MDEEALGTHPGSLLGPQEDSATLNCRHIEVRGGWRIIKEARKHFRLAILNTYTHSSAPRLLSPLRDRATDLLVYKAHLSPDRMAALPDLGPHAHPCRDRPTWLCRCDPGCSFHPHHSTHPSLSLEHYSATGHR